MRFGKLTDLIFLYAETIIYLNTIRKEQNKMTGQEYLIEILCCLPKELLNKRMKNSKEIPLWLEEIEEKNIKIAIKRYDEQRYKIIREQMLETL